MRESWPEKGEYRTWRECAAYAAEALESLRHDGSLRTDVDREKAHGILSVLAAEPLRISEAIEALYRLQSE